MSIIKTNYISFHWPVVFRRNKQAKQILLFQELEKTPAMSIL